MQGSKPKKEKSKDENPKPALKFEIYLTDVIEKAVKESFPEIDAKNCRIADV